MLEYKAEVTILHPPKVVWPVLVDLAHWKEWDPNCLKVEGGIAPGARLKIWSKLSPKRAFPVTVRELVPHQKLVFAGGMPLGLFTGVRTHTLRELEGGPGKPSTCHFAIHELFSGPLLGLFKSSIPDMTTPFQDFCQGLKARVETGK